VHCKKETEQRKDAVEVAGTGVSGDEEMAKVDVENNGKRDC
jgi:hypothetical protein